MALTVKEDFADRHHAEMVCGVTLSYALRCIVGFVPSVDVTPGVLIGAVSVIGDCRVSSCEAVAELLRGVIRSDHLLLLMRLSTAVLLTTHQTCIPVHIHRSNAWQMRSAL